MEKRAHVQGSMSAVAVTSREAMRKAVLAWLRRKCPAGENREREKEKRKRKRKKEGKEEEEEKVKEQEE